MGLSAGTEVFCMVISSTLLSKQNIIPQILSEGILHENEEQLMHFHRKVDKNKMKERLKQMRQHKRSRSNDT
jgi:hypothetical protein